MLTKIKEGNNYKHFQTSNLKICNNLFYAIIIAHNSTKSSIFFNLIQNQLFIYVVQTNRIIFVQFYPKRNVILLKSISNQKV